MFNIISKTNLIIKEIKLNGYLMKGILLLDLLDGKKYQHFHSGLDVRDKFFIKTRDEGLSEDVCLGKAMR